VSQFICTIATGDWVDKHLVRWLRYVKASNPGARLGLVAVGCERVGAVGAFDKVVEYGVEEAGNRDFWNLVRMGACRIFDEKRVVYCDADADIHGSLEGLEGVDCHGLGFVRSPAIHGVWKGLCDVTGEVWEANNGFLVLERDWTVEYGEALKAAIESGAPERIRGTVAFNLMVRKARGRWRELPYRNSVIWWDVEHLLDAAVVQWCSDKGQGRRLELEQLWREANR
jgi:hypothetical protein